MDTALNECRICKTTNVTDVIDIGLQTITSRFPTYGDFSTPKIPIVLCMCQTCGLIQLRQTTHPSQLYETEYGYRSGITNTMREHLRKYQEEILGVAQLTPGDVVIDIGSNDSTMLQYYSPNIRRIGVDPTGKQFQSYYGDVELLADYFTYENVVSRFGNIKCKIISSISMLYDLPDPVQFATDIYSLLDDDGIWTCEQSYLFSMIRTNSIDTICHEHLEYYALHQIKEISDRSGFKIIDVKFNDCNGGSFRIYFSKRESSRYTENTDVINRILQNERENGIMNPETYKRFIRECGYEVSKLNSFIRTIAADGKQAYIYGASTKGNCLLQYADLGESQIQYAVERNPDKIGKMTSTGIRIIGEEDMRKSPPEYLLVLPWHFKREIIERERGFLENGGQLIFPFPHFEIVGSSPKLLITGCDGMIAHYIKRQFTEYNVYGVSRSSATPEKRITKFTFDMSDETQLEECVSIVRPDIIIHLASISSSIKSLDNPIETIRCNGMLIALLCRIIHTRGWNTRLFNASSSEIFKGHVDYVVKDDDTNYFHCHPYSIAKIMGHSIVDFYRNTHGLPFSNGILFTCESPLKSPCFLLNKVAEHIRAWKSGNKRILQLGNLDSYRSILHATDVAEAIRVILSQNVGGGNYVICHEDSHKMYDLVVQMYSLSNMELYKTANRLYEKGSDLPVIQINDAPTASDAVVSNIRGEPYKLKQYGWTPTYTINDVLKDILSI